MIEVAAKRKKNPLNDPKAWVAPAYEAPLSDEAIAAFQKEVDLIMGTTRDSKSIVKLVWSGDKRYWKEVCLDFNLDGTPVEFIKRPILLHKTRRDAHDRLIADEFPPRWLLLSRIEPEQYADSWERDSQVFLPERQQLVQVLPPTAPKERYVWFATIADHDSLCCGKADEERRTCFGNYADAGKAIQVLRNVRKGLEEMGLDKAEPFTPPERATIKRWDNSVNNYVEQAQRKYTQQASVLIDGVANKAVKGMLKDSRDRALENIEKEIRRSNPELC